MNRIVKYIIFYSLVIGLLKSESVNNDIHSLHPVKLDVYDGDGSLLLHWAIPDTIKQNLVSIYRKSAQEKKFSLLTKIDNSSDRFLDLDVESSERYFYFVKILDDKNNIIKSDNIRPEFGTCLVESVIEKNGEIFSIWDLMSKIVSKSFSYHYPDIGKEIFSAIINILSLNDVHKNSWIEDFPINYLDNVEFIINKPSNLVFNDDIINDFKLLESKYRNYFKLTPKEWSKEIEKVYNETANKWSKLVDSFDSCLKKIKLSDPIIISGAQAKENHNQKIVLFITDIDRVKGKECYLTNQNETIDIDFDESSITGSELIFSIPSGWNQVELLLDNNPIDNINIIPDMNIIKTLDNEIITNNNNRSVKVSNVNDKLWLNEIFWDSKNQKLALELAGIPKTSNHYTIKIDNNILWEFYSEPSFEMVFIDSSFYLEFPDNKALVLSFENADQTNHSAELVLLDDSQNINSHRLPDGGKWEKALKSTFGSINIDQSKYMDASLIPELFVLYQNYPNPFNSNTRISFDLLQDAILSLYVTDATGRVKTVFSEQEFYNSGKYNFDWNAENFSTGIYFFTINAQVDGYFPVVFSRKMIYLK